MLLTGTAQLLRAELAPHARALNLADEAEREGDLFDQARAVVIVREVERAFVRARRVAVGVHRGKAVAGGFVCGDGARGVLRGPEMVGDLVLVGVARSARAALRCDREGGEPRSAAARGRASRA